MTVRQPEGDADENQVIIAGTVCKSPETRHSPAGISLTRFTLEHQSSRKTTGVPRQPRFRIVVVVAGEPLSREAGRLATGDRVRVTGFLSRSDYRRDERHLTLHAETLIRKQD